MLEDFLLANSAAVLARTQAKVRQRRCPAANELELTQGVPLLLAHLRDALRGAKSSERSEDEQRGLSAARHGNDLLFLGLSISQVVHGYREVYQVVTELAAEQEVLIPREEFRMLLRCLDHALMGSVTEYARQRERAIEGRTSDRLGILAHEMRGLIATAVLGFESLQSGSVAINSHTGQLLGRCLMGLSGLLEQSLAEVRLEGAREQERVAVVELLEEVEIGALLQTRVRGLHLQVRCMDRTLTLQGDRQILTAVVSTLLRNAFKFTRDQGHVVLTGRADADRVLFEVEDECGGLWGVKPKDRAPAFQHDAGRGEVGLSFCLKAAKMMDGTIRIRDVRGKGCIFTLDVPGRLTPSSPPSLSVIEGGRSPTSSRAPPL